jgi:arylsulfatase A-like enzyme
MATVSDRPNVIVFLTDQQRWDTTGLHGNPMGLTPNLDRLAHRGTHLASTFTPQPLCAPCRAVLQTGVHATVNGCFRNGLPLREDATTLARCFAEAGYRTGYIGKWHLGGEEPVTEARRGGYQDWLGANAIELVSDAYRCDVFDAGNRPVRLPGYRVDALTDAAIRYVGEHRDQSFFLFFSLLEPHQQNNRDEYAAPAGYYERYLSPWTPPDLASLPGSAARQLPGYYGMVKRIDEALGRVQDALTSLDLDRRTVVLFTSDHGCHFKTRNGEYKRTCHEASIHVPAALWGPGFDGGGRIEALVSLLDVPRTLLQAAGVPVPEQMQGRSLVPLVQGTEPAAGDGRDEVLIQVSESEVGRAVRTRRWKYYVHAPDRDPLRDAGSNRYVERHLYDLMADPYELNDLAGRESHREVADVLRQRLTRLMAAAGEPQCEIVAAERRAGGRFRPSRDEVSQ